ncbi:phage head closure protein [uncultured Lactobacillus sp.]|uniref:phage head closure protein n=1 Tax=uncultured Lactobacillus sp. TaxID=153152 RepID=UPI002606FB0F|nr:phage head closure protein [uncultured Lactobacillus sp.]
MTKHTSINIARMRYRIEFGRYVETDKINPNTGESINSFSPLLTVWAGKWSLSQSQQLTLVGAGIKDAVVFFIRHNPNIESDMTMRLGDNEYTIDSINYDDGLTANAFDLITCHRKVVDHG